MSTSSLPPPDCRNPHHPAMATRAINAEIAAWHLRGWAMIIDALIELRSVSSYDRQSEDGVGMLMGDAFRRMAETLEAPLPPAPRSSRRRRRLTPPDDNVQWLDDRLKELGRGDDGKRDR
jgi:hypothetical protein